MRFTLPEPWRERVGRISRTRLAWSAVAAFFAVVVTLALVFDWDWLRGPLARRIEASTGRPAAIGEMHGAWRGGPRLVLRDITVADDATQSQRPLFRAREMYFQVSVAPLLRGELRLAEVGLAGAEIALRRDRSGRANWTRRSDATAAAQRGEEPLWERIHIGALKLEDVVITLHDEATDTEARARVDSLLPGAEPEPWKTRIEVLGSYRKGRFAGQALTGPLITLRDTGTPFPIRGRFEVGRTAVEADGQLADVLGNMRIDTRLRISGPSLASLYPTLSVALPSTPPYRLQGHLQLKDRVYGFDEIIGRIGRSDIGGRAVFDMRSSRPHLTATLVSDRVALADLGAAIGVPQDDAAYTGDRVLPDAHFDIPRMKAMDADVSLNAHHLQVGPELPLENLSMKIELTDGVMRLRPLQFGFAGGDIVSTIVLDARQRPLSADAAIDFRKVDFSRLFPTLDTNRLSAGELGAQIRLTGRGQSVAELLSNADGTIAAAMDGGRISHTVVAAASLDGGKLLPLLLRGDEPVAIRCAALAMSVQQGMAHTQLLVLDTSEVRINGNGALDLKSERLALELNAQPKQASILSLRGPIYVEGTFRHPRVAVSAATLLRGGAAIALGVVNPLAALLPLIETGGGKDTDCVRALSPVDSAVKQAQKTSEQPPTVARSRTPRR